MIEIKEISKMLKSGKIIKLDAKRSGRRRSHMISVALSTKAMTSKEISKLLLIKIGTVYNNVRRMEKRGELEAFAYGRDVYYLKKLKEAIL